MQEANLLRCYLGGEVLHLLEEFRQDWMGTESLTERAASVFSNLKFLVIRLSVS